MEQLYNYLYSKDEKYSDIIITGVEYEIQSNLLNIRAQYTCGTFSVDDKEKFSKCIQQYFNNKILVECKFKKYFIDKDVISEHINNFLSSEFPSVLVNNKFLNIEVSKKEKHYFEVYITVDAENITYLETNEFENLLLDYLRKLTREDYEVKLFGKEFDEDKIDILKSRYKRLNSSLGEAIDYSPIEVRQIHNVVGEIDVDFVYPIATVQDGEKVFMVGTMSYFKVSDYESRFKNKDGTKRISKRANFVLKDGSDKISCVYFPVIADEEKLDEFLDGEKVVVMGDVTESEERGRSCKVKYIAKCDFDMFIKPEPKIEIQKVNEKYNYIFPKPFVAKTQSDLFTEDETIDNFLKENVVVVFDLETTGLNVNECEIIEIGAVKMVNGKIVETFDTLIKPKAPIPKDATAVNNITNEMVENCMYIEDVFPDFYKFIDGACLVAYNIAYDYGCLKAYGDKTGYVFNHKQVDALKLAKKALPEYKSHKLSKVVKVLGITLDNAHRALFDTIATAEVLKVTLNMLSDEDKSAII